MIDERDVVDILDMLAEEMPALYRNKVRQARQEVVELAEVGAGDVKVIEAPIEDTLWEQFSPWAKRFRQQCFGISEPPFSSWKEAERWLKDAQREYKKRLDAALEAYDAYEAYLAEYERLIEGRTKLLTEGIPRERVYDAIRDTKSWEEARGAILEKFYGISRVPKPTPVAEPPWWDYQGDAFRIASAIGHRYRDVMTYALVGIKPKLPTLRIFLRRNAFSVSENVEVGRATVVAEMHRHLTARDARRLYIEVRRLFGIKGKGHLTERAEKLLNLVKQKPRLAREGTGKYWERIRMEWNRRCNYKWTGERRFETWVGIMQAHDRAKLKSDEHPD